MPGPPDQRPVTDHGPSGDAPPRARPSGRVLVVEDDSAVSRALRKVLGREGLEVTVAETAAEARRAWEAAPPDLVFLDLGLPDADGRDLLDEIRTRPRLARTPIVVMTGRHSEPIRRECRARGADGFLDKPFDVQTVVREVDRLMAGREDRAPRFGPEWLPPGTELPPDLHERYRYWSGLTGRGTDVGLGFLSVDLGGDHPERRQIAEDAVRAAVDEVRKTLRTTDEIFVVPGGRLVLLMPATDAAGARQAVDRVRRSLRDPPGRQEEGRPPPRFAAGAVAIDARTGLLAALEDARRARRSSLHDPEAPAPSGPTEVLLVEDDDVMAALLRDRLQRAGHRVTRVSDGDAGIAHLKERSPDVVVLDLELPGVGGFEILSHIREEDRHAGVPVVVLTAMGQNEDATRAFEMGASDYMVKPLSPSELVARVERLLEPGA